MAKVSDWEIPREFGLGNELSRYRVRGYSLVGPEEIKQEFEMDVTAFSENQAEMRFRYLYGDGMTKVTEITRVDGVSPGNIAEGDAGREKYGPVSGD
jgi:hypothetical protein